MISRIFLYDEPAVPQLQLDNVVGFIENTFKIKTEKKDNIFKNAGRQIAKDLASIRIFNLHKQFEIHTPTTNEINFELNSFSNSANAGLIIPYDGFELQKIISSLIDEDENSLEFVHIVFTNKFACTFDLSDLRYHGRAIIAANPSVISTTGIVEAPAKPRQYYFDLMTNYTRGLYIDLIKQRYKDAFLDYSDQRLFEVVCGYAMQAVFYNITGEAFCESTDCRLYNAHWQHDLLYSQIKSAKLCEKHQKILQDWLT